MVEPAAVAGGAAVDFDTMLYFGGEDRAVARAVHAVSLAECSDMAASLLVFDLIEEFARREDGEIGLRLADLTEEDAIAGNEEVDLG